MKKVSPEQPARTRVTKDPQERREELLDIAWELGRSQGFEALRVEQIVQTAGIAKGTFYHYFAAKDDVVEALVQRFGDGLFAELSQAAAQPGTADERLSRIMTAATAYKLSHSDFSYASFLYREENRPIRQRLFRAWQQRARDVLLPVITAGADDGSFDISDAETTTDLVLLLWFDAADHLWLRATSAADADTFADIMFRGGAAIYQAQERILGMAPKSFTVPTDPAVTDLIKELYRTLDRNPS